MMLAFTSATFAETHIVGYAGPFGRIQAERLDYTTFLSGPQSTTTPAVSAGAGTSIWKVRIDGMVLLTRTGERETFVGPTRSVDIVSSGHALAADIGAGWRIFKLEGFDFDARAGYGAARIRIPTDVPIEDDKRFWTYGVAASRAIGSHYIVRIDVRNLQFHADALPETLGRFNLAILSGFGLRF